VSNPRFWTADLDRLLNSNNNTRNTASSVRR
jgi:hypothetical protein